MQVDHFNPTLTGAARHAYTNLYPACGHCNNKKSDAWPTRYEQRQGIRLLDPCVEKDYGVHLFEDPQTHKLVGATPAGRYHILICDLNAPTFVDERRRRASIRQQLQGLGFANLPENWSNLSQMLREVNKLVEAMIPDIPRASARPAAVQNN